jgi:hypothetical protein
MAEKDDRSTNRGLDDVDDIYLQAIPLEYRDLAITLVAVIGAWTLFKNHHDLDSPNLKCCDETRHLFDALDLLRRDAVEVYKSFLADIKQKGH